MCPSDLVRYFGKSVVDLTPGAGIFGEACLKHRVGYFCVAMTEEHAKGLMQRFQNAALRFMCQDSHGRLRELNKQ